METILCIAAAEWAGMWARAQQFMTLFSRQGSRVIYVDPPVTALSAFKNPALRGRPAGVVNRFSDSILVYSPPVFLPFGNIYRWINRFNQRLLAAGLSGVIGTAGLKPTLLWTCLPNSVDLLDRLSLAGAAVVYDCADEHTAFPGLIKKEMVAGMEAELFRRADVSLVSAGELYRRKLRLAPDALLVPNGADVSHFAAALDPALPLPADLAPLPRPVIGYVGAVSGWLDQAMVAAAARALPEGSFVLIGPVDTDVSLLESLPNVHLIGRRDYRELPAYLKGFDVATIPFKINELTLGVNPVKLYEYLAAGLPVVSAGLPEVEPFAPLVEIARTPAEFAATVLSAVPQKNSPEKVAARLEAARQHSWAARAMVASAAVDRAMKKEGSI
jgi:glycosyltransferase involved in cell wall biosynthesis